MKKYLKSKRRTESNQDSKKVKNEQVVEVEKKDISTENILGRNSKKKRKKKDNIKVERINFKTKNIDGEQETLKNLL